MINRLLFALCLLSQPAQADFFFAEDMAPAVEAPVIRTFIVPAGFGQVLLIGAFVYFSEPVATPVLLTHNGIQVSLLSQTDGPVASLVRTTSASREHPAFYQPLTQFSGQRGDGEWNFEVGDARYQRAVLTLLSPSAPEPGTWAMLVVGCLGVWVVVRRHER